MVLGEPVSGREVVGALVVASAFASDRRAVLKWAGGSGTGRNSA